MYEIVKVGIPIRECDITDEFINCINELKTNPDCVGISLVGYPGSYSDIINQNVEYKSSPAGHEYIFKHLRIQSYIDTFDPCCITTLENLWRIPDLHGMYRNQSFLTDILIMILNTSHIKTRFKKVFIFSQGSPLCHDGITEELLLKSNLKIIDTKSSIDICNDAFYDLLNKRNLSNIKVINRDYWKEFIFNEISAGIESEKLHVFPLIHNLYNLNLKIPLIDHFFTTLEKYLKPTDIVFSIYIDSTDVIIKEFNFEEYRDYIMFYKDNTKTNTFGILKL